VRVSFHLESGPNQEIAERVQAVLRSKDLTLYQVSRSSETLFGRNSPYYLPHNFYYDLRRGTFSPSLFQMFAFSSISNYGLEDWLRLFGFDIETIPSLQIALPSKRTSLLDSSLEDLNAFIPWLRNSRRETSIVPMVPLSRSLEWTQPRRLGSLVAQDDTGYLYAKIGEEDVLAFPELLPGSIVRVRPGTTNDLVKQAGESSKRFFLIEHHKGMSCCKIRPAGVGRIAILNNQLPFAQIEFEVPGEVRLIGATDLEIRSLTESGELPVARGLAKRRRPEALASAPTRLGLLLRHSRLRMGMSFRAASAATRQIANLLGDERYFIAAGSLSDYETFDTPPRHFHKIVSFCATYAVPLGTILATSGLALREAAREAMPDRLKLWTTGAVGAAQDRDEVERSGFIGELMDELQEIPFFLRRSLAPLSGLTRPSLKDFFWIGGMGNAEHPALAGGVLVIVNRRKKKPNESGSKPWWRQSLYVFLKRDGTYGCGCCSHENGDLIVHSYPGGVHRQEQLRHRDAEIVGKIVTIVRRT
jgi:hypothetical protein